MHLCYYLAAQPNNHAHIMSHMRRHHLYPAVVPCNSRIIFQTLHLSSYKSEKHMLLHYDFFDQSFEQVQYSSQVTSRVHALQGMRAREKLARAQGALEELRAKPKPLESWTIANLPARLLLRVLAQSWYSPYIKFTSQNIVTCSYNIAICTLYWTWLLCRSV